MQQTPSFVGSVTPIQQTPIFVEEFTKHIEDDPRLEAVIDHLRRVGLPIFGKVTIECYDKKVDVIKAPRMRLEITE
jgi:hypothetical protein